MRNKIHTKIKLKTSREEKKDTVVDMDKSKDNISSKLFYRICVRDDSLRLSAGWVRGGGVSSCAVGKKILSNAP